MSEKIVNILLVEDNPDDIKITERALEKGKVLNKLYVVRDGQEALDFLYHQGDYSDPQKAPRPGLILLDINLPKLSGIDVLKKVKSDEKFRRIPIIMLTVSKRDEDVIRSYDLGVNSYIVKPVEFDKFVETIKNIELYWILTNVSAEQ